MVGRPSKYSSTLANTICIRMSEGESLRAICREDGFPDKATVMRWLGQNTSFRDQYARAREAQADALVEECLDIADNGINDTYEKEDGTEIVNHDHIARSRLRVDTRKWWAARLAPKKYGDKVTTEISGPNEGPLVVSSNLDANGLTLEQIRALASIKVPG